jgi:hypothetical protein
MGLPPSTRRPAPQSAKELFDPQYYLDLYDDVRTADIDPFEHYMPSGWREGRNPRADLHTAYYLDDNPDVVASGMNPLEHYAASGAAEGRKTSLSASLGGAFGMGDDDILCLIASSPVVPR